MNSSDPADNVEIDFPLSSSQSAAAVGFDRAINPYSNSGTLLEEREDIGDDSASGAISPLAQMDGLVSTQAASRESRSLGVLPSLSFVGDLFEATNTTFSDGSGERTQSFGQLDRIFSDESVEGNFAIGPLNSSFADESHDGRPDGLGIGGIGSQLAHAMARRWQGSYSPPPYAQSNTDARDRFQSGIFSMAPTFLRPERHLRGAQFMAHLQPAASTPSPTSRSGIPSSTVSNDSVFHIEPTVQKEPEPLELPTNTRLKITIKRWNVAATWKWTAGDETCGICRMPFEACCTECKTPGDECPLALGACKHAFHMHCIVKWTETQNTSRPQCPLCRQEWKFAAG